MPVIIRGPGTNFLQKVGVKESLIKEMTDAKIKMTFGLKDFALVNKKNKVLATGHLRMPIHVLLTAPTGYKPLAQARIVVERAIRKALLKSIALSIKASSKTDPFVEE
jgi:hypothetical protein